MQRFWPTVLGVALIVLAATMLWWARPDDESAAVTLKEKVGGLLK